MPAVWAALSTAALWAVPITVVVALASGVYLVEDVVTLIWIGSAINLVISAVKFILAKAMPHGGKALMADSVHGLGDSLAEIVSAVAFMEASKPPDLEHPWGHGKIESIGALVVAGILLYVACSLGWESCSTLFHMASAVWYGSETMLTHDSDGDGWCQVSRATEGARSPASTPSRGPSTLATGGQRDRQSPQAARCGMRWPLRSAGKSYRRFLAEAAVAATLGSLVLKEALFRATLRAGESGASRLAVATAWHHRSDSMAAAAALISQVGASCGQHYMDPLGGGIVATMLARSAAHSLWESLQDLIDYNAAVDDTSSAWAHCGRAALGGSILNVPGVLNHTLRTRRMGPFCMVDATIVVEARISASAASVVAEAVHDRVIRDFQPYVTDVNVHVDPRGSPQSHRLDTRSEIAFASSAPMLILPEPSTVEEQVRNVLLSLGAMHPELPMILGISEMQTYFYDELEAHGGRSMSEATAECLQSPEASPRTCTTAEPPRVAVKVDLRLPQETCLKEAQILAGVARRELLTSLPDLVSEVDIDLELEEVDIAESVLEASEVKSSPSCSHGSSSRARSSTSSPSLDAQGWSSTWMPGSSDDASRHLRRVTLIWNRGAESREAEARPRKWFVQESMQRAAFPQGSGGVLSGRGGGRGDRHGTVPRAAPRAAAEHAAKSWPHGHV